MLRKKYFEWLLDYAGLDSDSYNSWIFKQLYETPFFSTIKMDNNRAKDGERLRLLFLNEYDNFKSDEILNPVVNVLEVLVALSHKTEDDIMGDGEYNYRKWFMEFCNNLGIFEAEDEAELGDIIEIWLSRNFSKNGKGSPFPLKVTDRDERNEEIWAQLTRYLNQKYLDF